MTQRIYIINQIAPHWKLVGLILGFSTEHLHVFELKCFGAQEICIEMMTNWLQGRVTEASITWNTLVEALRDARMDELADKLIAVLSNSEDG